MSDVTETLQDLMERRLKELGKRRGRGESISLREAYQRMLESWNDEAADKASRGVADDRPEPPTYEVFRRIRNGHTRITMLEVDIDLVYAAARIKPRLGRFELPTRADRLDDRQRQVVLDVVDAILTAAAPAATAAPRRRLRAVDDQAARDIGRPSRGQQRRADADQAGEPPADDLNDMEPR